MTGVDVAIVDQEIVHSGGLDLMARLTKAAGESQGAKSAQMGALGPIHQNFVEALPIEQKEQKQKLFWNPYGKRNGIR